MNQQEQSILDFLENSYTGANAMYDESCVTRLARAISAFKASPEVDIDRIFTSEFVTYIGEGKEAEFKEKTMKCKDCTFCTWSCPGYMCVNKKHPDFNPADDYPIAVELEDDSCNLFRPGGNDYKRFSKEGEYMS